MLAIIGASGKIGGATLDALLSYDLIPAQEIVACTSSSPDSNKWQSLQAKGVKVRYATFEDGSSMETAFEGCDKLYLVSTPQIELDYNDAKPGTGREKQHITAIDAARRAGVKHIYYTSLAFGSDSKAGVMRAHLRTEVYLSSLQDITSTILREGLYNESWPLYLGYYDPRNDDRSVVTIGGDGKISWTAIADLGLASALLMVAPEQQYAGKTLYLSSPPEYAKTMAEVADLVGKARGKDTSTKIVSRVEHEDYYINGRKMDGPGVKWWSTTYDALRDGECLIDDPTLMNLLASKGRKPIPLEETVKEMISQ